MTKQEKIREETVAAFRRLRLETRLNREPDSYHYADELLSKLDSQGVVIKKAGSRLPPIIQYGNCFGLYLDAQIQYQNEVLKAGLVAVESLIKEK